MAQIGIVRINDEYYREYQIDEDDNLWTICMRYGHRDYQQVYNLSPVNDAFRAQFPNPHEIDYIFPNLRLYLPLPGAPASGRSYRGKPIEDYVIANITDANGSPLANTPLRLINSDSSTGSYIETTTKGDVLLSNPQDGQISVVSMTHLLIDTTVPAAELSPIQIDSAEDEIELSQPINLQRNGFKNIIARQMFVVVCPMCGRTFRVVESILPEPQPVCPDDGFDLYSIITAIRTELESFLIQPAQAPATTPNAIVRRGTAGNLETVYGTTQVYWDESRFFNANQGDYSLWAPILGSINVRGRQLWNARAPMIAADRNYQYHGAPINPAGSWPYTVIAVPSSGIERLRTVFRWLTIHHSANLSLNGDGAPRRIQDEHIDDGIGPWYDKSPAADMAYHFVIDASGIVYEGRPLGISGSHVALFNSGNVGIVLSGNFEVAQDDDEFSQPTAAALESLDHLVGAITSVFEIDSVFGHQHRDRQKGESLSSSTECPGQRLIPHVENILRPNYPGQGEPVF